MGSAHVAKPKLLRMLQLMRCSAKIFGSIAFAALVIIDVNQYISNLNKT
jgi:hypothetical protein